MTSVVRIKRHEPSDKIEFGDLKVGDWYESNSCWGLCLKLAAGAFYSATLGQVHKVASRNWICQKVHVDIHPRLA